MLKAVSLTCLLSLTALPAAASNAVRPGANGMKMASVFADAGPVAKIFVVLLLLASLYVLALFIRRSLKPTASGAGAPFVAGLRWGGILAGLACALFLAMNVVVRMVYGGSVPPFVVWAPGLAEILLVLTAGLMASAIAAFIHPLMTQKQG